MSSWLAKHDFATKSIRSQETGALEFWDLEFQTAQQKVREWWGTLHQGGKLQELVVCCTEVGTDEVLEASKLFAFCLGVAMDDSNTLQISHLILCTENFENGCC